MSSERTELRPPSARIELSVRLRKGAIWHERSIKLPRGTHVIGRSSPADVVVDDDDVSRRHVEIEVGWLWVRFHDLGSTNGVRRDGRAVDGGLWAPSEALLLAENVELRHSPIPEPASRAYVVIAERAQVRRVVVEHTPAHVARGFALVHVHEGWQWVTAWEQEHEHVASAAPDGIEGYLVEGALHVLALAEDDAARAEAFFAEREVESGALRLVPPAPSALLVVAGTPVAAVDLRASTWRLDERWAFRREMEQLGARVIKAGLPGLHFVLGLDPKQVRAGRAPTGTTVRVGAATIVAGERPDEAFARAAGALTEAMCRDVPQARSAVSGGAELVQSDAACGACQRPTLVRHASASVWYCLACQRARAPATDSSSLAGVSLADIPTPVAYPLSLALDAPLAADRRAHNALFAAYQSIRLTALVLLADYVQQPQSHAGVAAALRGLAMPHWGDWVALADTLAKYWTGVHGPTLRPCRVGELAARWLAARAASADVSPLLAVCPGLDSLVARSAIDALWRARNDRAHRTGALHDDEESLSQAERLGALSGSLARALFGGSGLALGARTNLGATRLTGAIPDAPFDAPIEDGVACRTAEHVFSLHPFVVARLPEATLGEPAAMVDGVRKARVTYLDARGAYSSQVLAAEVGLALRPKAELDLIGRARATPWTIADASRERARALIAPMRKRLTSPELVIHSASEAALHAALRPAGAAVLLTGDEGAGKTQLALELVETLLTDDDTTDAVAWVVGASLPRTASALGLDASCVATLEDIVSLWERRRADDRQPGRRLVLVLDDLDGVEGRALLGALDALVDASMPVWLRLVAIVRSGSVARVLGGDGGSRRWRRVALAPLDPAEAELRYERHRSARGVQACLAPFATLPEWVRAGLRSPGAITAFHEVFAGRNRIPAGPGDLASEQLRRISMRSPTTERALQALAAHVIATRGFIAEGDLDEGTEEGDAGIEALVAAGVLRTASSADPPGALLVIAREPIAAEVVANAWLARRSLGELSAEDVAGWVQVAEARSEPTLDAALARMAERLARSGVANALAPLGAAGPDAARDAALDASSEPAALIAVWKSSRLAHDTVTRIARARSQRGDIAGVIALVAAWSPAEPSGVHMLLGARAWIASGEPARALDLLRTVSVPNAPVLIERGTLELKLGEPVRALESLRAGLLGGDLSLSARLRGLAQLGGALAALDRSAEAVEARMLAVGLARDARDPALLAHALDAAAEALRDARRAAEALPLLYEALALAWDACTQHALTDADASALAHQLENLGRSLRDAGQRENARAAISAAYGLWASAGADAAAAESERRLIALGVSSQELPALRGAHWVDLGGGYAREAGSEACVRRARDSARALIEVLPLPVVQSAQRPNREPDVEPLAEADIESKRFPPDDSEASRSLQRLLATPDSAWTRPMTAELARSLRLPVSGKERARGRDGRHEGLDIQSRRAVAGRCNPCASRGTRGVRIP